MGAALRNGLMCLCVLAGATILWQGCGPRTEPGGPAATRGGDSAAPAQQQVTLHVAGMTERLVLT